MKTSEHIIQQITEAIDLGLFTQRKKADISEYKEMIFDTVLARLLLYEITGRKRHLAEGVRYLEEKAQVHDGYVRWSSTLSLPLPPDADTTAVAFLLMAIAQEEKIPVPDALLPERNLSQFQELQDNSGMLYTWFGDHKPYHDVDPIVNATVAQLYARVGVQDKVHDSLRAYCNETMRTMTLDEEVSRYYHGGYFFVYRLASLLRHEPDFLFPEAARHLDTLLGEGSTPNTLHVALLSIAASYRGLAQEAQRYNAQFGHAEDGFYPFIPLYRGNGWEYGHPFITTLFALTALEIAHKLTPDHT
ncbi:hypothetical protein HYW21_05800 [Candidatus Woesearchaeota archaeon]|nr:hypothetical protein [Candidatus Woesearchaeota archaeon]